MAHNRQKASDRKARKLRDRIHQPDAEPDRIADMVGHLRQAMVLAPAGDGLITAPLSVAATYAAERMAESNDWDADERDAYKHWLLGTWGEAVNDLSTFESWREDCRAKVLASTRLMEDSEHEEQLRRH